jgi:prepilin-type N-terminal cleavage/methylation domain-containing protein/prepilin-type processing-associated H-X9-DG protein
MRTLVARRTVLPRQNVSGFTLTELLVVIAVIGVLATIIFPVIAITRASANSAGCLSNLRQIYVASASYCGDNKGDLVPIAAGTNSNGSDAKTWRYYLAPYLGDSPTLDALRCPSDENAAGRTEMDKQRYTLPASYGIVMATGLHKYLTNPLTTPSKTTSIIRAAHTIFVTDIARISNPSDRPSEWTAIQAPNVGSYGYSTMPSDGSWSGGNNWNAMPRHKGKVNAVFYDGHTAALDVVADLMAHRPGDPDCLYQNK